MRGEQDAHPGSSSPQRDHPRVRGEQQLPFRSRYALRGPSPRARGAGADGRCGRVRRGTIPACAGSRSAADSIAATMRDHPRVRGEQPPLVLPDDERLGPSPRARGAVGVGARAAAEGGTIPACAGSRSAAPVTPQKALDHPRVRGEQLCRPVARTMSAGPSPRARGAEPTCSPRARHEGTIPACAGSRLRDLGVCRGGARVFMTFVESGNSLIARITVIGCRSGGVWRRCSSRVEGWWSVRGRGAWPSGGG